MWDAKVNRFVQSAQSGTSMSAPLVAFAAALVRSEARDWSPVQTKRRILMAADLDADQDLGDQIKDGRKLNVVKAAAIQSDIVEMEDGQLLIGTLDFYNGDKRRLGLGDYIGFNCVNSDKRVLRKKDLLKIGKWSVRSDGRNFKLYFMGASPLFDEDVCSAPSDTLLKMQDFQSGQLQEIDISKVKDVVFKFSGRS
jgi:hypothetical protein